MDGHRIDAVLGRGGMGIVFKAENVELSRTVALKIINPALAQDDSFIRRFRLEARALAQIHHPNIVLVYAFRPFDLGYYISMEYVHGPTLAEYLETHGALSWNESVYLLKQMLSAFHFAHSAGVIHRDIKPRNILLAPNNVVKITDFGLAKVLQEGGGLGHDTTVTVATGGTIHYMPPEQIRGLKNVDHRGDIFSLGMSMYESLAGTLPFDKNASGYTIQKIIVEEPFPDIRKNNPEIPRALARIIMKALEKDPDKRYQSAAEMKAALEEFEKEQHTSGATTIYANGSQAPGVTLQTSRGKVYSLVAATVVCILLAFAIFYRPGRPAPPATGNSQPQQPPTASAASNQGPYPVTPGILSDDSTDILPGSGDSTFLATNASDTTRLPDEPVEPPAAPLVGSLWVESTPPGAQVRINGRNYGFTPTTVRGLSPGDVQVSLFKESYLPATMDATVDAGEVRAVLATLLRIQGSVQLSVRPSGDLYVDDELILEGITEEVEVKLPADTLLVSIRNPQYGEWRQTLIVTPGDPKIVSVDFTQTVRLRVTAFEEDGISFPPSAEIFLDGKSTGLFTPWQLEVPVGLHTLDVRAEGYELVDPPEPINFDGSTSNLFRFTLRKLPDDGRR
ncbi:MAG: serine/threonine-protein kinase [Rhodothermales bacterium]